MLANRLTWKTQQLGRYTFPYAYWDNFLPENELKAIEEYCQTKGVADSRVIDGNIIDARKSKSLIHNIDFENLWIFERLRMITEHANAEFFNFDLLGFDYFQYAEYQGEGSHYDYHTDLIYGQDLPNYMIFPRKLSFSLILSESTEYNGGEFQFKTDTDRPITLEQKRGRVIGFPSWILHRVAPLTSGVRRSIVWWCTGPKFR